MNVIARDSPSLALAQVHPVTASKMRENSRAGVQGGSRNFATTFFVRVGSHSVLGVREHLGMPLSAGQLLRSGVVLMSKLACLLCRQAYAIAARIPGD